MITSNVHANVLANVRADDLVPGWVLRSGLLLPSLDLNFTAGLYWAQGGSISPTLASLLTTTRASTGYAQWADGHLSLFAANIPRITDLGLLVEQAATNLALQSQALATSPWGKSAGATVTNNAAVAPDGTTTATAVSLNASAAANANQAQTLTAVSYTVSAYVQAQSGTQKFRLNYFDGTTSHTSADLTATTTWQRFTLTFTGVAASGNIGLATDVAAEATNLNVWGFQLELGSFPTSYIPTTTVAGARAADNIFAASPWLAGNFTMLAKASNIGSTAGFPTLVDLSNAGRTSFFLLYAHNTTVSGKELVAGVTSFDNAVSASGVSGSATKSVMTLNGTAFRGVSNGAAAASLGTLAAVSGLTQFDIGSQGGANSLNGYVTRVAFWNTGMTDAQMQAVTT